MVMTARDRKQARQYYSMLSSLNLAVIEVGGCEFSTDKLLHMTAYELLETLAPNGIRFGLKEKTKRYLREGGE